MDRLFKKFWGKLGIVTQWFFTFMMVNVLWIVFRAEDISSAGLFIKKMCSLSSFTIREELYDSLDLKELSYIPFLNYLSSHITGFSLWLFIFGAFFVVLNFRNCKEKEFQATALTSVTVVVLLVWSVLSFAGISTFLYFNF